jgi:hypothetical protein
VSRPRHHDERRHPPASGRRPRIIDLLGPSGPRIEGDLDLTVLPARHGRRPSSPDGDISLDLARLGLFDVGRLRAVVTTAAALADDRVLTLRSTPPRTRRLLELTGRRDTPHLRVTC